MSAPRVVIQANRRAPDSNHAGNCQQIVRYGGVDGADAFPARNGGNSGDIRVELRSSPSQGLDVLDETRGGFRHVCIGQDVLITATGGPGENGGVGANGQRGSAGYDGRDATRYQDATDGGNGQRGGNGGHGSHGGAGGHGGSIEVKMSEDNMHLAYVVDWDVTGGRGGAPGRHGQGGKGGRGGRGGSGCSWQVQDGYRWKCVAGCTYGSSSAVTTTRPSVGTLREGVPLYLAISSGAISDGQNTYPLNNVVAQIPASHRALIQDALDSSGSSQALVQSGGSHSSGCGNVPMYRTESRPRGRNGCAGPDGHTPNSPLFPGRPGNPGRGKFLVYDSDFPVIRTEYASRFEFMLQDFSVADENGDDVYEPGECVLISALEVANINKSSRGMPTPIRTQIPATLKPCNWLHSIPGRDNVFLPTDIAPQQTKTTGSATMWAKVQLPQPALIKDKIFSASETIALEATIPDIDRKANNFAFTRTITIQYPLYFEPKSIKYLQAMPRNSSASIKWPVGGLRSLGKRKLALTVKQVSNRSSRALGSNSLSRRQVKTSIETESEAVILGDTLVSITNISTKSSEETIETLDAYQTHVISKLLQITSDAQEYSCLRFLIQLQATPIRSIVDTDDQAWRTSTMQTQTIEVQVTNSYEYNTSSKFLLLTSRSTTKEYLDGWMNFIRDELHCQADVWNVSQYGGIKVWESNNSVLDNYAGKTVLGLDDPFDYQSNGERTALDFVDAKRSNELARRHTSFIFAKKLPKSDDKSLDTKLSEIAFSRLVEVPNLLSSASRARDKAELYQLLETPSQALATFILDCDDPQRSGPRLARVLRRRFPRDRFIVTSGPDGLDLVILQCTPQGQTFRVDQVGTKRNATSDVSGLSLSEAYTLISGLPFTQKLDILFDVVKKRKSYSDFVILATKHAVKHELHQQVTCLASRPRWSHTILSFKPEKFTTNSLLGDVHDKISMLLSHDICQPVSGIGAQDLPSIALELLESAILSARCQTSLQILTKLLNPWRRTRSHVRKGLLDQVKLLLASSALPGDNSHAEQSSIQFKGFKHRVRQKLMDKDNGKMISRRVSTLTRGQVSPKIPSKRRSKAEDTTLESIFSKTCWMSTKDIENWHKHHDRAEDQQLGDFDHLQSLAQDLNFIKGSEPSRNPNTQGTLDTPQQQPSTLESGIQELLAGELPATPVPARHEANPSPVTDPSRLRSAMNNNEEDAQNLAPSTPQGPPFELMSRSVGWPVEMRGDTDPVYELLRRGSGRNVQQLSRLHNTTVDVNAAEILLAALYASSLMRPTEAPIEEEEVD